MLLHCRRHSSPSSPRCPIIAVCGGAINDGLKSFVKRTASSLGVCCFLPNSGMVMTSTCCRPSLFSWELQTDRCRSALVAARGTRVQLFPISDHCTCTCSEHGRNKGYSSTRVQLYSCSLSSCMISGVMRWGPVDSGWSQPAHRPRQPDPRSPFGLKLRARSGTHQAFALFRAPVAAGDAKI